MLTEMVAQPLHERLPYRLPVLLVQFQGVQPLQATPQRLHVKRVARVTDFMDGNSQWDEGVERIVHACLRTVVATVGERRQSLS